MKREYLPHKSLLNLDARYVAAGCYILPLLELFINFPGILGTMLMVLPIFIFFAAKDSEFVRFHALQSFILNFVFLTIVTTILVVLSIIGILQLQLFGIVALVLDLIVSIGVICLSIYGTIKALNYWTTSIPLLSKFVYKFI